MSNIEWDEEDWELDPEEERAEGSAAPRYAEEPEQDVADVEEEAPKKKKKKPTCSKFDAEAFAKLSRNAIISSAGRVRLPDSEKVKLSLDKETLEILDEWIKEVNNKLPDVKTSKTELMRAAIWYINEMRKRGKVNWVTLTRWKPPW